MDNEELAHMLDSIKSALLASETSSLRTEVAICKLYLHVVDGEEYEK
jgi:hypothetical protein